MKLKKFDQYMEQDQHRMESEKDVVIQNQIDDLSDDSMETDITPIDLSANELDKLRKACIG